MLSGSGAKTTTQSAPCTAFSSSGKGAQILQKLECSRLTQRISSQFLCICASWRTSDFMSNLAYWKVEEEGMTDHASLRTASWFFEKPMAGCSKSLDKQKLMESNLTAHTKPLFLASVLLTFSTWRIKPAGKNSLPLCHEKLFFYVFRRV